MTTASSLRSTPPALASSGTSVVVMGPPVGSCRKRTSRVGRVPVNTSEWRRATLRLIGRGRPGVACFDRRDGLLQLLAQEALPEQPDHQPDHPPFEVLTVAYH